MITEYESSELWISSRLAMLNLEPADRKYSAILHEGVIRPAAYRIVDNFYSFLVSQADFRIILEGPYSIDRLKQTQRRYLLTLGKDFDSEAYFSERFNVGVTHYRVGLPLTLYQCAYRVLQQQILDELRASEYRNQDIYDDLVAFVLKITALDMSLAIEAYHNVRIRSLEKSLHTLIEEDEMLRHRVETDQLTQLYSQGHTVDVIRRALETLEKLNKPFCVIMADLDHFKTINDLRGHLVGDRVLQGVAARLRSAVRDFDTVGRYGGEEFLIVLDNINEQSAMEIAGRIQTHMAGSAMHIDGQLIDITISQGVAMARKGDSPEILIGRADKALYLAKAAGRNCVRRAVPE